MNPTTASAVEASERCPGDMAAIRLLLTNVWLQLLVLGSGGVGSAFGLRWIMGRTDVTVRRGRP